ncbi:MAG: hypothetical protein WCD88_19220 [Desulfobacterales bacterium]
MNLKAKNYVANQKNAAVNSLAARTALLTGKGLDEGAMRRDPSIRKIKATIRKANFRLASIAAQEKLNAERIQDRERKAAEKKTAPEAPAVKKGADDAGRKEKKEKKKKMAV